MRVFFNKLRDGIAGRILRGRIRQSWLKRKTSRLVAQYEQTLLRVDRTAAAARPARKFGAVDRLRRLLLVCDGMWEQRELVPELSRVCEVTFVDVHSHVQDSTTPPHETLLPQPVIAQLPDPGRTQFDAVLVYLRSSLLSEELIRFLRKQWSCPLIGLNLDCKTTFDDYDVFRRDPVGYRKWAGRFDVNLTNTRAMMDVYRAAGFDCLYLPTGYHYDPAIRRLRTDANFEIGISFVGSCKPERRDVVEYLRERGIEVRVFGGGWGDQPFVRDAWRVYQQSQLNLGIGYNVPDMRITNLKNRDFECPGSGACYLTTYDWELAGLYDVGREILCYRSLDDLIELFTYYSRRPEDCLRIAAAGFERCRRDHTWEQRFRTVFKEMGFRVEPSGGGRSGSPVET
jgi:hypothetical protein